MQENRSVCLFLNTVYVVNPLDFKGNYSATSNNTKPVHWPLVGGLLHLVQRGGAWAGCSPAPSPLLAVPNVTAHPSTASVPISVLMSMQECVAKRKCKFLANYVKSDNILCYVCQNTAAHELNMLRGVYSDTTQLNSIRRRVELCRYRRVSIATQLNSTQLTQLNSVQPSQSCFCLRRHDLQSESTGFIDR